MCDLGRAEKRMRRLLPLLLAGLATPLLAQSEPPLAEPGLPRTKLEILAAQEGAVIVRGFSRIGEVKGPLESSVVVRSQEVTNTSTGEKEYGVSLEVRERARPEREHTSYVDYDEIGSLLKGLEYLTKLDNTATSFNRFQADYRTRGELEISTYTTDASAVVAAAVTCGTIEKATALLNLADLDTLRLLVDAARAEIDKKRGATR
jgi:hypothetical protein